MPVNSHTLVRVFFWIRGGVTQELAYAYADSKECRFSSQSLEEKKVRVLLKLLNQSGAFEPHNEAFNEYGMRIRVTEAGKSSSSAFPACLLEILKRT